MQDLGTDFANFEWFNWFVFFGRFSAMVLGAALAGFIVRRILPTWSTLKNSEKAYATGLLTYSLNTVLFVALALGHAQAKVPDSLLWVGVSASFVFFHRAMYLTEPVEQEDNDV